MHLLETPSETVFAHLCKEPLEAKRYNVNYCTTVARVKELFNYSKSSEDLDLRINQLRYTH